MLVLYKNESYFLGSFSPCDSGTVQAVPLYRAVPKLRWLVAGVSLRRAGFAPGSIHLGFVVDKVALGQVLLRILRFSPVNIIPPSLSNSYHLSVIGSSLETNSHPIKINQSINQSVNPFV
jgi:hypothetical protein